MRPPPFDYRAPRSLGEALDALAEAGEDGKLLAGGQSLVPLLALRLARPAVLIDLQHVPGLDTITREDGWVRIGSMVRERAAERSPLVAAGLPLLAAALPLVGHPAIRNRGTVGGSVAHADPAAEIPAVTVALDAQLVAASAGGGERTIPAGEFATANFTTTLAEDEALVAVRFPAAGAGTGAAFEEAARRPGDFAIVGAAVTLRQEAGTVVSAAITLAGVAPVPLRRPAAERLLVGSPGSAADVEAAAAAAAEGIDPPADLHGTPAYRRQLARVLTRRAVRKAAVLAGLPLEVA